MKEITLRQAVTAEDAAHFWQKLNAYHARDIFPEPESEDLEYFLGDEYHDHMEKIRTRQQNRAYFLIFDRDDVEIGFCMPVIYDSEDGKCFLMEFCVYPEFRGNGTGSACARVFLDWAANHGAEYVEINCDSEQRARFWGRCGFLPNGRDEWGVPLMIRMPVKSVPFTVEQLTDPEDWQLMKLMNGFLSDIGEECMEEDKQEQLQKAVKDGKITFFVAKRGYRLVGMCSVSTHFSTFCCGNVGVFDDFYIEPVFRNQGIAPMLAKAAQDWCRQNEIASLTVACAPCDEQMYQHLGFDVPLGRSFAAITGA